jgi:hypothetical protein
MVLSDRFIQLTSCILEFSLVLGERFIQSSFCFLPDGLAFRSVPAVKVIDRDFMIPRCSLQLGFCCGDAMSHCVNVHPQVDILVCEFALFGLQFLD